MSESSASITVHANIVENTITPLMSGANIEDVNHSLYGGLYAQMVFGESFEEPPGMQPLPGWSVRDGWWRLAGEGVLEALPRGTKIVWDEALLGDGTVECEVMLQDDTGENAGLILRVNDPRRGGDAFVGYEVSLSARNGYVRLARHEHNRPPLCDVPMELSSREWIRLKVTLDRGRLCVFVGDAAEPRIALTDPDPLRPGRVGLRTTRATAGFRRLRVTSGAETWSADLRPEQAFRHKGEVSGMWDGFTTGDADAHFTWDEVNPFNTDRAQRIEIRSVTGGTAGVANRGLNRWGLSVRAGGAYEGRLYLRGECDGDLTVALQNATGTKTYATQKLTGIGPEWRKHPLRLVSDATDNDARLAVWIDRIGTVWVDQIVLMPPGEERFEGVPVRSDIARTLVDEGLTALRLGGGMVNRSGYRWKTMIGDPDTRLQYSGMFYPWSTRGFGIEEFVQFCRSAGIEPVVAINISENPEDAAHLIEYLNAPATTTWGKVRAGNGHVEPYSVRYIQIGNEERNDPLYLERFLILYEAMRRRDASVEFIIACWWDPDEPNSIEIVRQLRDKAAMWDLHVGGDELREGDRVEEMILNMQRLIEKWDPGTPMKACILEENGGQHSLRRGLGHAHIRNTAERFGDFILMECPANCLQPDGQNDNGWDQGQVFFDNHQAWLQPPGYTQQMAARHHQPYRVAARVSCPNDALDVTATRSASGDTIVLKVVNLEEKAHSTRIEIQGVVSIAPRANTVVLTGDDLDAINTPTHPRRIAPVEGVTGTSAEFTYEFCGYSYTIIELKAETEVA